MNTRRKRQRRTKSESPSSAVINKKRNDGEEHEKNASSRAEYRLENLPPEVLEMIFRLLPFCDVSASIRLVSRRFSTIATSVLNGAFLAAGARLDATMSHIEATRLSRAGTDLDLFVWSRAFNVLELVRAQYKMLKAVTWRYTHPPKSANFNRICFYAGSLLDELNAVLDMARNRPRALSSSGTSESRARGVATISYEEIINSPISSPRVVSFVALCKRFMNYFEKVSECKVNRSALVSGCKAIDVLDCLAVGREITRFHVSSSGRTRSPLRETNPGSSSSPPSQMIRIGGSGPDDVIVTMGLRYVLRRAWFTCLQVPCAPDENSWREDQRFMYLRLRRLVGSVNEHHFEKSHFERDLLLRTSRAIGAGGRRAARNPAVHHQQPPRPPPASTYSGYGVYAGRFFYYGNMNKYAYESKFKHIGHDTGVSSSDESGQDDEAADDDDEEESAENRNVTVALRRGAPTFDLVIKVELRCSGNLAPLAVIPSLRTSELDDRQESPLMARAPAIGDNLDRPVLSPDSCDETTTCQDQEYQEIYYKLNISCPASAANRLPGSFMWEQRGPSHSRRKRSDQEQRLSH